MILFEQFRTGVRTHRLCPPGTCEACDRYWQRLGERYESAAVVRRDSAPVDQDASTSTAAEAGQTDLHTFEEVSA